MTNRPHKMPSGKRLALLVIGSTLAALGALGIFYFFALDHIFTHAESVAKVRGVYPEAQSDTARAETQTEPHTCGLHAIRSLYQSHGLDPDTYNLRFRLGTDRLAISVVETSQGTVQADIYRVLAQDGFHVARLDLGAGHQRQVLMQHLVGDLKALALIRRPENGNLHWILLQARTPDQLVLVDSLKDEPVIESPDVFLDQQAISVALLFPGTEDDLPSIKEAYRLGVAEMRRTPSRMSHLEKNVVDGSPQNL